MLRAATCSDFSGMVTSGNRSRRPCFSKNTARSRPPSGRAPVWLMLASTILRKAHYRSIWERPLLSIVDPDLKELSWDRATLWFRDKVSIFRADLITEVAYFWVLSYLVFVAAWRWVSDDPLSVMTDWLQVGVNLVAIMLLGLLWVRIKKMNEQLAKAIEEEIRLRELERRHG